MTTCPAPTRLRRRSLRRCSVVRTRPAAGGGREEAAIDEVPEDVLSAARRAFDTRDPGVAVAHLVDDLTVDRHGLAAVRLLRFGTDPEDPALEVDVVVRELDDRYVLALAVRPARVLDVEVRHPGAPLRTATRPDGYGEVGPVLPGLVSVLLADRAPASRTVQTAWVTLP